MISSYQVKNQNGAALLAVLIVALVLVILMSVASQTMQGRLSLAQNSKQRIHDLAEVQAKISELTYLVATQRFTYAGISKGKDPKGAITDKEGYWVLPIIGDEIRSDGEPIIVGNGLSYSIQNEAGLVPLNTSSQYWLKRWLNKTGYSAAEQRYFADTLADYADSDDWQRAAGAEKANYKDSLFTEPANFLLQNCSELWKVFSWAAMLPQHPEILALCSLSRIDTLNLNAIPLSLWQLYWPNSAKKIGNQRLQGKWLQNREDILAIEPELLNENENYYSTMGGNQFQIEVISNNSSIQLRLDRGMGIQPPFTIRMME
jgi:general secretion pathway protein K